MEPIKTYFIGGIASDERIFRHQLVAVPNAVYLPFPHQDKHDTMETYVRKFLPKIDTTQPFHLVGNSMGGIMTMELTRIIQPRKVVLISSVKSRHEMPFILKHLKYTNAHKLLPGKGFIAAMELGSLFKPEVMQVPGMRNMAVSMAKNNHPSFLYWCVDAIVKWNGKEDYRDDIIHIHGTKDEMFPFSRIKNPIAVRGGTHTMLLNRHEEVNRILLEQLA